MNLLFKTTSVFLALGFVFSFALTSCDKDTKKKITGGSSQIVDVPTNTPQDTIPQDEKTTVENSPILSPSNYEIFELRFGSYFVSADGSSFTITNNVKFNLVVGIKNKNTGNILYRDISYTDWTFNSDNSAVAKTNNSAFTALKEFYIDSPANISISITYKGLSKAFSFVLNSSVGKPGITPLEGTWLQPDSNSMTGDNIWTFSGNLVSIKVGGYTYKTTCTYNSTTNVMTLGKLSGSGPLSGRDLGTATITTINANHITLGTNHLYKPDYATPFNLEGTWQCVLIDDYDHVSIFATYVLIFSGNNFTCKKDGNIISQGTFTTSGDTYITFSTPLVPPYYDYNIAYVKIGTGSAFKLVYDNISANAIFYKE